MNIQKIGRYEVEQKLGQGGMAVVYLARDPYINRKVAIKVLHKQNTSNLDVRTGFLREAESVASLEHPFIVPIYDFGEENEANYIVMRLMLGGTLTDKIKKRGSHLFSEVEIINILQRIGSALDSAHLQGIVHRDLKPDNILYDRYKGAFLADFGIAHHTSDDNSANSGAILGTPAYMSPEQFEGSTNLDGRSDLYALGVIVFELLTGRQPYIGKTLMELMTKHITEPVPRVLDFNANLSSACQQVIQKAMAKEPNERYNTAGEMVTALAAAMVETESATTMVTIDVPIPSIQDDLFTKATAFITTLNSVVKEKTLEGQGQIESGLTIDEGKQRASDKLFNKASKFIAVLDEISRMELALKEANNKRLPQPDLNSVDSSESSAGQNGQKNLQKINSLNVSCPNCKKKTSADESHCPWCGTSLIGSLSFH